MKSFWLLNFAPEAAEVHNDIFTFQIPFKFPFNFGLKTRSFCSMTFFFKRILLIFLLFWILVNFAPEAAEVHNDIFVPLRPQRYTTTFTPP